ncbi:MAG: heme/copper-type cytochrome/quinol oxidase subunit 2 [Paraglaciecola sp.]|jgi:heme/copper-type cytochrome/quinol oxidase subunit 2
MKNLNQTTKQVQNRRKSPRENDKFFQCMVFINVLGWFVFIGALLVFHDARPEFVSGVQAFWGIEGRQEWSKTLTMYLVGLLSLCVVISVMVLVMKRRRNRRDKDYFGINGYVLMVTAVSSLIILYFEFTAT